MPAKRTTSTAFAGWGQEWEQLATLKLLSARHVMGTVFIACDRISFSLRVACRYHERPGLSMAFVPETDVSGAWDVMCYSERSSGATQRGRIQCD